MPIADLLKLEVLPEIMGADKDEIWSTNGGTQSQGVAYKQNEGSLQNRTVIKGQGMQANSINSSILLPEINHTDSTVYSSVNRDSAQPANKKRVPRGTSLDYN